MKRKLVIISILIIAILGFIIYIQPDKPLPKSCTIDKIVVEKSKRRLYVYSNGELIKIYKISLGKQPIGDKEFEGDKKTPEGRYIINDKNPRSGYYKNLGISYPNKQDIEHANEIGKKPGGQVKIHGLKNGKGWIGKFHLLKDWTNGCIAMTNKEVEELYNAVKIGTPIENKP